MAHYGHVLRRSWWIILLTTVFATAAAIAASQSQQRLYSASAQVLLANQNLASALSNIVVSNPDPARVAQTQADLARVPTVAQQDARGARSHRPHRGRVPRSTRRCRPAPMPTSSPSPSPILIRVLAAALATAYARQYTSYRRRIDTASLKRARTQIATQLAQLEDRGQARVGALRQPAREGPAAGDDAGAPDVQRLGRPHRRATRR